MKPYFVFTMLFLLALLLFVLAFFFLKGDATWIVGSVATVLTIAIIVYGFENTKD